MGDYYNIALIGSGNLAWHLGPELENAGQRIVEIYSRNIENARKLQKRLYSAEVNDSLDFSKSKAQIFFLCVSDDAIEEVAREIVLPDDALLAHTSGSQPLSKLGYAATAQIGVFYPLQTFTKSKQVSFEDIPLLIEAEDRHTGKVLSRIGKSISKKVMQIRSEDRIAIHVAAVFACNFTNHFFSIAEQILGKHNQKLELLRPLIAETMNKSLDIGPEKARTGPAVREDMETLDRHMAFLEGNQHQELYQLITEDILNRK